MEDAKKNELKPHLRKCWVIPPQQNAAFVANMEEVLEVYKRPYNPAIPVICMDEQPTQLIKETRMKIAVEPGKVERVDYEYERNGTATNFMFTEPLGRWRQVNIRQRKTSIDWAYEVKELLDQDYPDAEKVILVMDNLTRIRSHPFMRRLIRKRHGDLPNAWRYIIRPSMAVGLMWQR